jgi:hypothetical protein
LGGEAFGPQLPEEGGCCARTKLAILWLIVRGLPPADGVYEVRVDSRRVRTDAEDIAQRSDQARCGGAELRGVITDRV